MSLLPSQSLQFTFPSLSHLSSTQFNLVLPSGTQNILKVFYYNICLLAVPVFFQISLFIFYNKQAIDQSYFRKKKLQDLLIIYSIWMSIGLVVNSLVSKGEDLFALDNLENLTIFFISGSRPELYFLFSLIFLTVLAFLNHKYLVDRKHILYCFRR
jgi:surface polysaccharide O-acyltransferase-like enzyme